MHVCMYIHIYIYVCVSGGLCVLWEAGGIIFNIFEVVLECSDISLSILVQRPHKQLYLLKPARPEEKDEAD